MSENLNNYLQELNESQREAVENNSGATLVLAGAGSGKTRVLTFKLLHLLVKKILTPNQILAVTFTNKAASEMKSRVSAMLNFPIDKMWLGTFHSLSLKILRKNFDKVGLKQNFVIIDTDDQLKLIKKICEHENIDSKDISPKFFSNAIDSLKKLVENNPQKYFAVLVEPFSASSLLELSTNFLVELRDICTKNNIVLIGPEGDFSKNELKDAQINGFKFVTLGNSRLRAETAGIMTCAMFSMI